MSGVSARTIAYLGGNGSFSEEACRRFAPAHDLMPLGDFAAVAKAVCQGSADVALLPVSNSRAGPIAIVHQLLAHPELRVVGHETLAVRLHLLALPGSSLERIATVASHPAALVQCASYLARRGWTATPLASTAEAARQVQLSGDPTRAAIASEPAAAIYGLEVLAHDVQGRDDNVTCFAIVERREHYA